MMGTTVAADRVESKSPKQANHAAPPRPDAPGESQPHDVALKPDSANVEAANTLAPPPRPTAQQDGNTPDYFTKLVAGGGSLSLEPNPFEQSFGSAPQDTPGKLPSLAALTSPSSLLPGPGVTPFPWGGGSLRSGPLSPAMLSGPTSTDYFGDNHHIRASFPTPNESSLRSGLTPGGSGSMFPVPSPNTQALFASLQTPGALDFHRTAMSAAASKREAEQAQPRATSQPQEQKNGAPAPRLMKQESKLATGSFDNHDNDAANGLFLLAQGRNGAQSQPPVPHAHPPPPAHAPSGLAPPVQAPVQAPSGSPRGKGNGSISAGSGRGVSEAASPGSDESEQARPVTRGKGKRNSAGGAANGRGKAEDAPGRVPPSKRAKMSDGHASIDDMDDFSDEDDMKMKQEDGGSKTRMTDEEKRKNFLERNRVAALKCRQRKKQWLANLQNKVELYSSENDALTAQISQLREEVVNLKTLLLAHKDCPVTQQQGLHGAYMAQQGMESYNAQMNPYGMAAPLPNQPVMAGQPVNRRFS